MRFVLCGLLPLCLGATACGDPRLPPASFRNVVDTITVYAVTGTAVHLPSGYSITEARAVRLDQSASTDFAFDITPGGDRIFLPGWLVGQPGIGGVDPGLQHTVAEFESIRIAVQNGYVLRDTVPAAAGEVYYIRSRIPGTCFLGVPLYGKLQVLGINPEARSVTFQVMVNLNCGYRSLEEGLPGG